MTTEIQWLDGNKWLEGRTETLGKAVETPLTYRKPRRMTLAGDLFHEDVPDEFIDRVFAVMALTPQHKYQILTKRPKRMEQYIAGGRDGDERRICAAVTEGFARAGFVGGEVRRILRDTGRPPIPVGKMLPFKPLPNVQLGVSVEDQTTADERVPHLLNTPAAFRFASYEPALGPVDWLPLCFSCGARLAFRGPDWICTSAACGHTDQNVHGGFLDLIIAGGESGPGARPCQLDWLRSTVSQCGEAGLAVFVKQLGSCASDPKNGIAGAKLKVPAEGRGLG